MIDAKVVVDSSAPGEVVLTARSPLETFLRRSKAPDTGSVRGLEARKCELFKLVGDFVCSEIAQS